MYSDQGDKTMQKHSTAILHQIDNRERKTRASYSITSMSQMTMTLRDKKNWKLDVSIERSLYPKDMLIISAFLSPQHHDKQLHPVMNLDVLGPPTLTSPTSCHQKDLCSPSLENLSH